MFREIEEAALRATVISAIACYPHIGKNDKIAADLAATSAIRSHLNQQNFITKVMIGEGERDEAPMLYRGEILGQGHAEYEMAVDPLEGTNQCATNKPGSMTAVALGSQGCFMSMPDIYMNKIATGIQNLPPKTLNLSSTIEQNICELANVIGLPVASIGVTVLDRPRHFEIIASLKNLKVDLFLVPDGDVAAIMETIDHKHNGRHLYVGVGGAPEGILAAVAIKSVGGFMQGQLYPYQKEDEKKYDCKTTYTANDMVKKEAILACTGVTGGFLSPISFSEYTYFTESILFDTLNKSNKRIRLNSPHSE